MSTSAVRPTSDSTPGTGARRATGIVQLYFRMCGYSPLVVLVADALCLVFGAEGATVLQLVDYLGVGPARVRDAVECIPLGMRCTSDESRFSRLAEGGLPAPEEEGTRGATKKKRAEVNRIHYLNYKVLLPAAYAHVTRILLRLLSVSPPPSSPHPPPPGMLRPSFAAPTEPNATTTPSLVMLSAFLQREPEDTREGVPCSSCLMFHHITEFQTRPGRVLCPCPACGADVLQTTLRALQEWYLGECHAGRPLLLPPNSAFPSSAAAIRALPRAVPQSLNSPLARDPLLVQQALQFFGLFAAPFACLNDDPYVTEIADILTHSEFQRRRAGGGVGGVEMFQAAHRNANAVRVVLQSSEATRRAKKQATEEMMAKRSRQPPWMRQRGVAGTLPLETEGHPSKRSREAEGCGVYHASAVANFIVAEYVEDEFEPVELPLLRLRRLD